MTLVAFMGPLTESSSFSSEPATFCEKIFRSSFYFLDDGVVPIFVKTYFKF